MEGILLVIGGSPACDRAAEVWRRAAGHAGWSLRVEDIDSPSGAALAAALGVHAVPSLVVEGRVVAVGTPAEGRAEALLGSLAPPAREGG